MEYLESTGTQYIDTGFKANTTTTRLDIGLSITDISASHALFGSRNTANSADATACNAFCLTTGTFRWDWAVGSSSATSDVTIGNKYDVSITRGNLTVNGSTTTYTNTGSINQNYNFLLFNFSNGSATPYPTGMVGRIYYAKLYSNNVLVRDFVPVRVGTTGYMYDRVTGRLFGNAGAGDFILGPNKPIARDYVQDGLVAMWDGIENAGYGVHDTNATGWKDLAGNKNGTISTAANGWTSESLNTKKTSSIAAAVTFGRFQFSEIGTLEMVYRVDSCQNANGETFLFVGGGNRTALSFVSGGSAQHQIIVTTPDKRLNVRESDYPGIVTAGVRHQTSIIWGSSTALTGWSIRQDGEIIIFNAPYTGSVTVQTNSVGSFFGRTTGAANNALGEICCARIYGRALTADEIAANYAVDKARFGL